MILAMFGKVGRKAACLAILMAHFGAAQTIRASSDEDVSSYSYSRRFISEADLPPYEKDQRSIEGPAIYSDGQLAASLKMAVWLDRGHEYRTYLIELQKALVKEDEIEVYTIEQVGEKEFLSTVFRIHQAWNGSANHQRVNMFGQTQWLNKDGNVPKGSMQCCGNWQPKEYYNGKRTGRTVWDLAKSEVII